MSATLSALPLRLLIAALLAICVTAQQPPAPPLHVLELSGTPYERGFSHGTQLRTEIAALVELWRQDVAKTSGVDADTFVARFLAATKYDAAARRWTPGLLDEVRGIAAGAGQPYATMFAYQLIDELWAQMPLLFAHKCTTIGVDRDGDRPAFVAQNLDVPRWMHAYPTVLRIRHPDRELQSLVVTMPGLVGANGINDHRVGVCVNTVLQIRACRDGLPVAFVVRGLLEQPDHAAALAFLQQVPHASGQAYTVGGPDTAPCFECSAGKKVRFEPFANAQRTWHTNHPLVSDDWSELWRAHLTGNGKQPGEVPFVCPRFATASEQLRAGMPVDVDKVKALLASKAPAGPICNPGTYVCTVMVLGVEPQLHIAPGPPDRTPFQTLNFMAPR